MWLFSSLFGLLGRSRVAPTTPAPCQLTVAFAKAYGYEGKSIPLWVALFVNGKQCGKRQYFRLVVKSTFDARGGLQHHFKADRKLTIIVPRQGIATIKAYGQRVGGKV